MLEDFADLLFLESQNKSSGFFEVTFSAGKETFSDRILCSTSHIRFLKCLSSGTSKTRLFAAVQQVEVLVEDDEPLVVAYFPVSRLKRQLDGIIGIVDVVQVHRLLVDHQAHLKEKNPTPDEKNFERRCAFGEPRNKTTDRILPGGSLIVLHLGEPHEADLAAYQAVPNVVSVHVADRQRPIAGPERKQVLLTPGAARDLLVVLPQDRNFSANVRPGIRNSPLRLSATFKTRERTSRSDGCKSASFPWSYRWRAPVLLSTTPIWITHPWKKKKKTEDIVGVTE